MRIQRSVLFLTGALLLAGIGWTQRAPAPTSAAPPATTRAETTEEGLILHLTIPEFSVDPVELAGTRTDQFRFEGQTGTLDRPGAPQLPVIQLIIGAPPEGDIRLDVEQARSRTLSGRYTVSPAPSPTQLSEDLTPGEKEIRPDPAIYTSGLPYPAAAAEIGSEAWLRGQRMVRLTISPFQYSPDTGEVTFTSDLELHIRFSDPQPASPCADCTYEAELEGVFRQQLVNYEQSRGWRVASGTDAMRSQIQSPETNPFLGPRYEIVVDADGIYRVTYADLQAAGMDVDNVDPQTFRLVNQAQDVAVHVAGEGDGSFDPGDYVLFYGEKFHGDVMEDRYQDSMTKPGNVFWDPLYAANNWFWLCREGCDLTSYFERYTNDNVYYLLAGGAPGPRMASVDGTPAGAPVPDHYFETVRAEEQNEWWSHEFYDDEVWFWNRIRSYNISVNPGIYETDLSAVASGAYTATVHLEFSTRFHDAGATPDYHTRFALNGQIFDDRYWDGLKRFTVTAQVPQSILQEGTNTLSATLLSDVVLPAPDFLFDFYEITYARNFEAINDQLAFEYSQPGTWQFEVGGLTSAAAEVFDILDPLNPVRILNPQISGGAGSYTASFEASTGAQARYITSGTQNALLTPKKIAGYNPPDFASLPPAEIVLITHASLITSTQALADFRADQGFSTAVIDVEDLYREFNDGIYHPIAIKNFLAYGFANWPTPPVYVTLIGNGNFNMKNFGDGTKSYHNAPPTYMPPNLAYVDPWQGETDSANLLATVIGDDTVPDVHIGRIPVNDDAQMAGVVAKIIAYETSGTAGWQKNVMFIADNVPDLAGNFINFSESIINDYIDPHPYLQPQRIYLDDGDGVPSGGDFGCTTVGSANCDNATTAIISTLNVTGTLVVNYIGHASPNRWTGEQVFINPDIASLNNAGQLPVVLSMTCLDGFWTYPNTESLAYLFLTSADKGAIATFSPTGLGVSTGHDYLHRGFYDSMLADGDWQLGPATTSGKLLLWSAGFYYDLLQTFTVFGDPALGVKNPYRFSLTPTAAAQTGDSGTEVTYDLTIQNTGAAPDSFAVQVAPGSWNAAPSTAVVGPLAPNQSTQFQVTVSIPASALDGQLDETTVLVTSRGDASKSHSAQLTTTAQTAGLSVTPANQTKFGEAGTDLLFTLTLTNTTPLTDTFSTQLSGANWSVSLPAQVGPLGGGASTTVPITVSIPQGTQPGESDLISITFISQNTPANTAVAVLQSIVSGGQIYLPIIQR